MTGTEYRFYKSRSKWHHRYWRGLEQMDKNEAAAITKILEWTLTQLRHLEGEVAASGRTLFSRSTRRILLLAHRTVIAPVLPQKRGSNIACHLRGQDSLRIDAWLVVDLNRSVLEVLRFGLLP